MTNGEKFKEVFGFGADGSRVIAVNAAWWDCEFQNRNPMIYEATILNAICTTMQCDKCPYPCKAKQQSSMANCVAHWSELLSELKPNTDWKEVRYLALFNKQEE